MSITNEVAKAVDCLAGDPNRGDEKRLQIREGPAELTIEFAAVDGIGCAFHRICWSTPALAQADLGRLRSLSDQFATRLNYLLEPVVADEIDGQSGVARLRSDPPSQSTEGTTYYEVFVRRGGEVELRRFRATHGAKRLAIPAFVTREVLLRLVEDLTRLTAE